MSVSLIQLVKEAARDRDKNRKKRFLALLAKRKSFGKSAVYEWGNYSRLGGGGGMPQGAHRAIFNNLVQHGLNTYGRSNTIGARLERSSDNLPLVQMQRLQREAEAARQQEQSDYDRRSSFWNLFSNPGEYADAVLGRYNQQSTGQKIMGNIGSGATLVGTAMGVNHLAHGLKGGAGALAKEVGLTNAGSMLSGAQGGPGTFQKLLAAPATFAGNMEDRAQYSGQNYQGFMDLINRGRQDPRFLETAKTSYPQMWKAYQDGARGNDLAGSSPSWTWGDFFGWS